MIEETKNTIETDRVLALAGLLQSVWGVEQIASGKQLEERYFNASLNSLFQFDADSTAAVYGGAEGVEQGLKCLSDMLTARSIDQYRSSLRYALAVLHLQRQLAGDDVLLATIGRRLRHSALQANHFADHSDDIAASCAAVYQDTISTYRYRIKINGSVAALASPRSVNRIRALLLAGIRSATLWRQLGGRRWHVALSRKKMLVAIEQLAAATPPQH